MSLLYMFGCLQNDGQSVNYRQSVQFDMYPNVYLFFLHIFGELVYIVQHKTKKLDKTFEQGSSFCVPIG